MASVALSNVTVRIDEAEDSGGDEPVIILALITVGAEVNNVNPVGVDIFDSGILGDDSPAGSTFQVPIQPPGHGQRVDGQFKTFQAQIDETKGDQFVIFAQAWDDDESTVTKRRSNRSLLRSEVTAAWSEFAPHSRRFERASTAILAGCEGSDDLLG